MRFTAPGFLLVALVTVLALILTVALALYVARSRARYGVAAPATTGHPDFERAYRIHANTTEQLAAFIASLWLCAIYLQPLLAAVVGFVWIAGRIVYAFSYSADPARRSVGFAISLIAVVVLIVGALVGIARAFFSLP
jgi:glutathione S-transferase